LLSALTEATTDDTTNPNRSPFFNWRDPEPFPETDTETENESGYLTPVDDETEQLPIHEMSNNSNKKEYGIKKPDDFDGNRKEIQSFLLNCKVYLQTNRHVYDTDEAKIAFILTFMNEKEAKRWKENYLLNIMDAAGDIVFPTLAVFMKKLETDFKTANKERDAAHQIAILRQGKKTAEETITEFRLLTNQAGYANTTTSDHMHLIGKLQTVLNTNLVRRVLLLDNVPTTIDTWAEKAIQIDSNYRQTLETIERLNEEKKTSKPSSSSSSKSNSNTTSNNSWRKKQDKKDPNAMDIDTMSAGKRAYLMKKGACFICEETGHRASEHDDHVKEQQKGKGKDKTPPKRDLRAIHALFKGLTTEEQQELLAMTTGEAKKDDEERKDDSEDEGF